MFLFSVTPFCALAQNGIPSEGREYFIGFVAPSFNRQVVSDPALQQHFRVSLLIAAFSKATVTISYYDDRGVELYDHTITIESRRSATVSLDLAKLIGDTIGDVASYHTCHVVSTAAISVQCYSTGICSGGSYLALPPQCWGKEYVVMSYHDNPDGLGGLASSERSRGFFQIVASENATQIEITPSSRTAGGHEGIYYGDGATGIPKPYSIMLNRGQSYTVFSDGSSYESDISGSRISSTKPIGVLAGHENAYSDDSNVEPFIVDERNFMIQQLIPVECWDASYASVPLFEKGADPGNQYRLFFGEGYKSQKNTGSVSATSIEQNLDIEKYQFPQPSKSLAVGTGWVSIDSKFSVMQYGHRRQNVSGMSATPCMMNVIPDQCWKREYAFVVPPTNSSEEQSTYITIIVSNAYDLYSFKISFNGGVPVPITAVASLQKTVTLVSKYYWAKGYVLRVQPGSYIITSWAPFALYNYGFQAVTIGNQEYNFSYGSPAGMGFARQDLPPSEMKVSYTTDCDIWTITVQSNTKQNGIRYISLDSGSMAFDERIDPLRKGEILLSGVDTLYSFTMHRVDHGDLTAASISFYDCAGKRIALSLPFRQDQFKFFSGEYNPWNQPKALGSTLIFPQTICGQSCDDSVKLYYIDPEFYWPFDKEISVWINAITNSDTSEFSVSVADPSSANPFLPVVLPNKLWANSYLKLKINFTPKYNGLRKGTVRIETCSGVLALNLLGESEGGTDPVDDDNGGDGGSGGNGSEDNNTFERLIVTDAYFSNTDTGKSSCKPITITNKTHQPVTLLEGTQLLDTEIFSLDENYFMKLLPIRLEPGASIEMLAWFHPHSFSTISSGVRWLTDLPQKLEANSKTISVLRGNGVIPKETLSVKAPNIIVDRTNGAFKFDDEMVKEYSVYDLLGQIVFHSDERPDKININGLSSGTYIIRAKLIDGKTIDKLINLR